MDRRYQCCEFIGAGSVIEGCVSAMAMPSHLLYGTTAKAIAVLLIICVGMRLSRRKLSRPKAALLAFAIIAWFPVAHYILTEIGDFSPHVQGVDECGFPLDKHPLPTLLTNPKSGS